MDSTTPEQLANPAAAPRSRDQAPTGCEPRSRGPDRRRYRFEPCQAWAVLVGVFLSNAVYLTPDFLISLGYQDIAQLHELSMQEVGWVSQAGEIASICSGLCLGAVIHRVGCRPVAMVGGLVSMAGLALAYTAHNYFSLLLYLGVLSGAGRGATLLCNQVVVHHHFHYNRGLATGLSTLGFSVSTITVPILVQYLLNQHGLRATYMWAACIVAQHVVFASLYLPAQDNNTPGERGDMDSFSDTNSASRQPDEIATAGDEMLAHDATSIRESSSNGRERCTQQREKNVCSTKTGSCDNPQMFMGLEMLKNVRYVLLFFTTCAGDIVYTTMYIQGPNRMKEIGLTPDLAAGMMSTVGISNVVLRLALTALLNFSWFNECVCMTLGYVCGALSSALLVAGHPNAVIASAVMFGLYEGTVNTVDSLVLVRIVGPVYLSCGVSLMKIASLPAIFLAAPFFGWLSDEYHTYVGGFYVAAAMGMLGFILMAAISVIKSRSKRISW